MTRESRLPDVEVYLEAARQHGNESEPDHEIGDLRSLLRAIWEVVSIEQRLTFAQRADVQMILSFRDHSGTPRDF